MKTTTTTPQDVENLAKDVAAALLDVDASAGQRQSARNMFVAMLDRTLESGIPRMGMFTVRGDLKVWRTVDRIVRQAQQLEDLPSLEALEEQLDYELDYLSRNSEFGEASDTDVRDTAYDYLRRAVGG